MACSTLLVTKTGTLWPSMCAAMTCKGSDCVHAAWQYPDVLLDSPQSLRSGECRSCIVCLEGQIGSGLLQRLDGRPCISTYVLPVVLSACSLRSLQSKESLSIWASASVCSPCDSCTCMHVCAHTAAAKWSVRSWRIWMNPVSCNLAVRDHDVSIDMPLTDHESGVERDTVCSDLQL